MQCKMPSWRLRFLTFSMKPRLTCSKNCSLYFLFRLFSRLFNCLLLKMKFVGRSFLFSLHESLMNCIRIWFVGRRECVAPMWVVFFAMVFVGGWLLFEFLFSENIWWALCRTFLISFSNWSVVFLLTFYTSTFWVHRIFVCLSPRQFRHLCWRWRIDRRSSTDVILLHFSWRCVSTQ